MAAHNPIAASALGRDWLDPRRVDPQSLDPQSLDPQSLDRFGTAAFWIATAIIFAECGLLIRLFLPGDSLLFMVGLFVASGVIDIPIALHSAIGGALWATGVTLLGYFLGNIAVVRTTSN